MGLRGLIRRFRLAWNKPDHWQLRPGTFDARAFRDVAIENEYRLPKSFSPDDVLLDVGAHVGSFAFAALHRGAGMVHCFEPNDDNFRQLTHNLQPYSNRVTLNPCAVWRSDVPPPRLSLHNPNPRNTGGYQVTINSAGPAVAVLPFDELLDSLLPPGKTLRLLKLDCEGAEWPILLTSRRLHRITALCGEYHLGDYAEAFPVAGFPEFTPEVLEAFLRDHGFAVQIQHNHRSPHPIGNFFAQRERVAAGGFPVSRLHSSGPSE